MRRGFDSRYPHQMAKNFWQKLQPRADRPRAGKNPFFVLAPMHGVTNFDFRQTLLKTGRPDVFYTGFVSADGLCSGAGKKSALSLLKYSKREKPIVAQIFGSKPEKFYEAAKIIKKLGFDGIDINMGCPDQGINKQGSGAALIKSPELAIKIIEATKRGAGSMPVSVKTRIGYYEKETEKWVKKILSAKPAALTIHGRTTSQGYGGLADWGEIKKAAQLAKKLGVVVIGNGDIKSLEEGIIKANDSGCDGIMIGREALKNPWVFNKNKKEVSVKERLETLLHHLKIFQKKKYSKHDLSHFRIYITGCISGFPSSKEMRIGLMESKTPRELEGRIKLLLKSNGVG